VPARFFIDENDLALGKSLAAELDVVYPGHPDLPEVPRGSLDDQWLPVIGDDGLVVITRDRKIRYRPAEKLAWVDHRVRGFVLTGAKSQTTVDSRRSSTVTGIASRPWSKRGRTVRGCKHLPRTVCVRSTSPRRRRLRTWPERRWAA